MSLVLPEGVLLEERPRVGHEQLRVVRDGEGRLGGDRRRQGQRGAPSLKIIYV